MTTSMYNEYSELRQTIRGKWINKYNASLPQKIYYHEEFGEMTIAIGGIYDGEWELYQFDNHMSNRIKRELKKEGKMKNWELAVAMRGECLELDEKVLVSGIVCSACGLVLEPHTTEEHLDTIDPIHSCLLGHKRKD